MSGKPVDPTGGMMTRPWITMKLFGGMALALFLAASTTGSFAVARATTPQQGPLIVGVSAHPFRKGRDYRSVIDAIAKSGAQSIRFDVRWPRIERKKGHLVIPKRLDDLVNYAKEKHIDVLMILDTSNPHYENRHKPTTKEAIDAYVRFARFVAEHFKGKVHLYEVWNEWNLTIHGRGGNARQYMALLKPTYEALKSVDRNITVLGGSLTPNAMNGKYLTNLLALGALNYMNGLAVHPYNYCSKKRGIQNWRDSLQVVEQKIMRISGRTVPLYLTEMGLPTSTGKCGVSPPTQATALYQTVQAASAMPFVAGIWWYNLYDNTGRSTVAGNRFGLMHPDGQPKPSYQALQRITSHLRTNPSPTTSGGRP